VSPALVLTTCAIAGAVGIATLALRGPGDPAEPSPDTRTAAEDSDLIPKGGPTP
jgi:hypothetical protein